LYIPDRAVEFSFAERTRREVIMKKYEFSDQTIHLVREMTLSAERGKEASAKH
jgi:hypothetical protein